MTIKAHQTLLLTGAAGGLGQALRERLKAFETQTLDLSEIAEQIIVDRMQRYDEALLVLRARLRFAFDFNGSR